MKGTPEELCHVPGNDNRPCVRPGGVVYQCGECPVGLSAKDQLVAQVQEQSAANVEVFPSRIYVFNGDHLQGVVSSLGVKDSMGQPIPLPDPSPPPAGKAP